MILTIFLVDVERTPEIMVGFFYVIPVVTSYWSTDRRMIYAIALIATVASIAGLFLAASGIPDYMAINRPFSVILLWIAAFAGDKRLEFERTIETERNRLRTILDVLPLGLAVVDKDGRMVQTNPSYYAIWGENAPSPEDYGQYDKYKAWFIDTDHQLGPEDWPTTKTLHDGQPRIGDILNILRFDGEHATISHSVVPIEGYDDGMVGAVIVIQDVTEKRRLEQEVDRKAIDLARSNAELQQFAYVASHDLQEPLRMVTNYLGLLQKEYAGKLDGESLDYLRYAVDGGFRMKILIDDLLAYSRIESQRKSMTSVDMNEVVDQTIDHLKSAEQGSGATIRRDPLPTLIADGAQMVQVMMSLLGNALKFRGKDPPQISISSSRIDKEWVFAVKDNGIGLNPIYSEKVFEMFVRLHSREAYPGTGIGLPICKRIIERHGGRIWVESQEGQGATFFFTVPTSSGGTVT